MSYQEKKVIASLVAGVILIIAYVVRVFQILQHESAELAGNPVFWAQNMLVFFAVGIGVSIVILIIFHILNAIVNEVKRQEQDDTDIEDEMDKLISLKAPRNSFIIVGIGFVSALFVMAFQHSVVLTLNIIFLSFFLGSFMEGLSQLYFYRRGV